MQKISEDVRALRTKQILEHYEFFEALVTQIFNLFQHTNFARQTRLFSNVVFMLFKDLIKIYKVYYVHITEILERFPTLSADEGQKSFIMYQNFVNLTDSIKTKANKLIYTFNFPIQLPDSYNPEKGLVETLKMVVDELGSGGGNGVAEISTQLRKGMNRDQFQTQATKAYDDGDKEYYFDCKVLENLDSSKPIPIDEEFKVNTNANKDNNIDLMDFISKSDFSTVGGRAQTEVVRQPPRQQEFEFGNNFNNKGGLPANDFFAPQQPVIKQQSNNGMADLMDIFSAPATNN